MVISQVYQVIKSHLLHGAESFLRS